MDIGGGTSSGQSAMGAAAADDMLLDIGDDDEGSLDMDPALRATDKDLEAMSLLTREFVDWLVCWVDFGLGVTLILLLCKTTVLLLMS